MKHFELCADALGHRVQVNLELPDQAQMAVPGLLPCGTITVEFDADKPNDALAEVIKNRQTSRKKYTAGLSPSEREHAIKIAEAHGLTTRFVTQPQAEQVIWLNQRAVFDDFFNPKVREELHHWFRYTAEEKHTKKDGLAYDCMELSGVSMRLAVKHYKWLHWPIVAPLLKKYYLRTMRDNSSIGYMAAPFTTEAQAYTIGRCIMETWIEIAKLGHYLHPFGTVVSNDQAHADFVELVGHMNESREKNYVVFIFRAGVSDPPVDSERLPITEHLYKNKG